MVASGIFVSSRKWLACPVNFPAAILQLHAARDVHGLGHHFTDDAARHVAGRLRAFLYIKDARQLEALAGRRGRAPLMVLRE
eukprot:1894024-Lingulodinium_polyedra.AAC.1